MEAYVTMSHVVKYYQAKKGLFAKGSEPVKAVDDISLEIARGETLGLVGESGCGKSTLARLICGLELPDHGHMLIQSSPKNGHVMPVQMVFQDPYTSLNPRKKVGQILTDAMVHHGICKRSEADREAERLLKLVGLNAGFKDRYPYEFSGGQRQRIGIARALALDPDILVLDEPVSALDVLVQAQILNLLEDLKAKLGLTCLFIGHGLAGVRYLSDRIAVMYMGKIVEIAPADEIFAHPLHPYTKALKEAAPASDPRKRDEHLKSIHGEVHNSAELKSGCTFRTRCPYALEQCQHASMKLTEKHPGHLSACILDRL